MFADELRRVSFAPSPGLDPIDPMRTFQIACALAAFAAAPVPAAYADESDAESVRVREVRTREVRFEGVAALPEAELRDAILTAEPTWKFWRPAPPFDEESLREDLERIVGFYRERGYYDAQAEYDVALEDGDSKARVTIHVREGPPVLLVASSIAAADPDWLEAPTRSDLLTELPLRNGETFGSIAYLGAKQELLRRLADLGHPAARLEGGADVDLSTHTAKLHWTIHPGPVVRFGATRVEGLEDVDAELVLRELTYREGEVFSVATLDASQQQIYALGLFRAVTLQDERQRAPDDPSETGSATWPVVVRVEERPPRTVRVSAGYGTEDEFRGQVSWAHRNWFGGARVLDLTAKYSSLLVGGDARLTQSRFLDPKLSLESNVSFLRETVPAYDAYRVSGGVSLGRPLLGSWRGRVGYRFEWSDVTNFKADDTEGDTSGRTSTLLFGLTRSTVDDPIDPRSGTWLDLAVAPTLEAIGSEATFVNLSAEGRGYLPVYATVLAARLRAGTIQPFAGSGIDDVPTVMRFFSGGSGSVRGFEFQHLPPLDGDDPLGGLTLIEGTLELRFPIWRFVHGVAFVDAGQLSESPFAIGRFHVSAGPGIRITTPIGALGLDYGTLLNPPRGADRGRIHFSVGASF